MINSAEEFVALRSSENKDEYDRAAFDEASESVWMDIIYRYPDYRKWVAHNKTVPISILRELCNFDSEVRYFVSVKRKLSLEIFEILAQDPDPLVRQGVASNKKTPITILQRLAVDSDENVARVARFNAESR